MCSSDLASARAVPWGPGAKGRLSRSTPRWAKVVHGQIVPPPARTRHAIQKDAGVVDQRVVGIWSSDRFVKARLNEHLRCEVVVEELTSA